MTDTSGVLAAGPYHISFDWPVFFSQLFGFVVIIFVFVRWILPPLKRMMARSQDTIARQLEESSKAADRLDEAKKSYDNALVESFISTIKCELIKRRTWKTRDQARLAVFQYIETFYNPRRRHSALGYRSPADYELE